MKYKDHNPKKFWVKIQLSYKHNGLSQFWDPTEFFWKGHEIKINQNPNESNSEYGAVSPCELGRSAIWEEDLLERYSFINKHQMILFILFRIHTYMYRTYTYI